MPDMVDSYGPHRRDQAFIGMGGLEGVASSSRRVRQNGRKMYGMARKGEKQGQLMPGATRPWIWADCPHAPEPPEDK